MRSIHQSGTRFGGALLPDADAIITGTQTLPATLTQAGAFTLNGATVNVTEERVVIETAKHDRMFSVRHNAHCAKFKANDKLDEFLAWMVRLVQWEQPAWMAQRVSPAWMALQASLVWPVNPAIRASIWRRAASHCSTRAACTVPQ